MSTVPKENIEVIAQSVGINNLSHDGSLALARDVEYRIREIMQEAIKCMCHSRRTKLTTEDVDTALSVRNVEPVYGFASGEPLRFRRAGGHKDLFYIDDKDVDFKDVIEAPLPKLPLDTSISCHWLAIEGVQPTIPENVPVKVISAPDTIEPENKDVEHPVDINLPIKHVLSRELQLYLDKVTELVVNSSESVHFKQALTSLATDPGLHPLVPYFTCFIADEVSRGLGDFRLLFALMRLVRSLLRNHHIHMDLYLHQLMPSVVTCLVAKRLGNRFADDHWKLRDFTAKLVASICKRYGHVYSNLQPRLTKTLINAFLDPKLSITQHYGAVQRLAALGPNVDSQEMMAAAVTAEEEVKAAAVTAEEEVDVAVVTAREEIEVAVLIAEEEMKSAALSAEEEMMYGSGNPTRYYKCIHPICSGKKELERKSAGQTAQIAEIFSHNILGTTMKLQATLQNKRVLVQVVSGNFSFEGRDREHYLGAIT